MSYKGIKGDWSSVKLDVPGIRQICIASSAIPEVVATMYLPEYVITDKIEATTALMTQSLNLLRALEELVRLKEWKEFHGKDEYYVVSQPMAWDNARAVIAEATKQK